MKFNSKGVFFAVVLAITLLALLCWLVPQRQYAQSEQSKVCEIHGEILKPERVKVIYGYFDIDGRWLENTDFPHSNQYILKGCAEVKYIRPDGSCEKKSGAKYEDVFYCEKCRETENAWLKAKGKKYKPFVRIGILY